VLVHLLRSTFQLHCWALHPHSCTRAVPDPHAAAQPLHTASAQHVSLPPTVSQQQEAMMVPLQGHSTHWMHLLKKHLHYSLLQPSAVYRQQTKPGWQQALASGVFEVAAPSHATVCNLNQSSPEQYCEQSAAGSVDSISNCLQHCSVVFHQGWKPRAWDRGQGVPRQGSRLAAQPIAAARSCRMTLAALQLLSQVQLYYWLSCHASVLEKCSRQ
jgi:hypothetical protein